MWNLKFKSETLFTPAEVSSLWANMSKYWQRSLIKSPYVSRHHKSWQKYPTFGRISAVEHSTLIQIYPWLHKYSTKSFRPGDSAKKLAKADQKNCNWRNHGKNIQHLTVYQEYSTMIQIFRWFRKKSKKCKGFNKSYQKYIETVCIVETFSNYKIKARLKAFSSRPHWWKT
jgi:hypothetical protein